MGKAASKLRFATRPVKNYNVENRAFKVISRDKPTPAPRHPSTQKLMDEIKKDPNFAWSAKDKMSQEELKNLSQVYVKSTGDNPIISSKDNLPKDRHTHEDYMYGFHEPDKIPKGKVTLKQLTQLLEKRITDPQTHTAETLSEEYKLNLQDTKNILEYFRTFQVIVQPKENDPTRLERAKALIAKPFVFDGSATSKKKSSP